MRRLFVSITLLILLSILAGGTWLLGSENGNRTLLQQSLGEQLQIGALRGSLFGVLVLEDIKLRQEQWELKIAALELHWQPGALLKGKLHIQQLLLNGVHYSQTGTSSTQAASALPSLPLSVQLDLAELENLRLQTGDNIQEIRRIALRAATQGNEIEFSNVQVNYDRYQVDAEGRLTLTDKTPFSWHIRWHGELPEIGQASGEAQVDGDRHALKIEHTTDTPFKTATRGRIEFTPNTPRLNLKGEWSQIRWPLLTRSFVTSPEGRFQLSGPLLSPHLEITTHLDFPQGQAPAVTAHLQGQLSANGLSDLTLEANLLDGQARIAGQLQWAPAPTWNLTVNGEKLDPSRQWSDWPGSLTLEATTQGGIKTEGLWLTTDLKLLTGSLRQQPISASGRGSYDQAGIKVQSLRLQSGPNAVEAEGALAEDQLDIKYVILPGGLAPAMTAHLQGQLTAESMRNLVLEANLLDGKARVAGQLQWTPAPTWDLTINGEKLDPSRQWSDWPGSLALEAAVQGGVKPQGLWLAADLKQMSGSLRQQNVSANGRGSYDSAGVNLQSLQLHSGPNKLNLQGKIGEQLDLDYIIKAPDLAAFWPALKGQINGKGRVGGKHNAPEVAATLNASALSYADHRIERLQANLIWKKGQARGKIEASGLRVGAWNGKTLSLEITGTPEKHRLHLDLDAAEIQLTASAAGGWQAPLWQGHIKQLEIVQPQFGRWKNDQPIALLAGAEQLKLERSCLIQGSSRLCSQIQWTPTTSNISGDLTNLALKPLLHNLYEKVAIEGSIDGKLQLQGPLAALRGEAQLELQRGMLQLESPEDENLPLELRDGTVTLQITPESNQAELSIKVGEGVISSLLTTGPLGTTGPIPLSGKVNAKIPYLQQLNPLLQGLTNIRGNLSAEATLSGTLDQPTVVGVFNLAEGAAVVPQLGLELESIQLSARNQGVERLLLEGGITSGSGRLTINGNLLLNAAQGWPLTLQLNGKNIQVARLPEAEIEVSPDLKMVLSRKQLLVRGKLLLPQANIEFKELPKKAILVSKDEIIVGQTAVVPSSPPLAIDAEVTLRVGDKVKFSGFGLTTRLEGTVELYSKEARNLAQGELSLHEGRYRAYGQDLTIEQGRLVFNGSLENPNLDIKATRLSQDHSVTAELSLSGNLRVPQVTISSTPPLPEEEALSYLLTGKGLAEESPGTATMLRQAAAAKGLEKSQEILNRLASGLGVDEVRLTEGSNLQDTTLLLGKYLSPDLYVSYAVGLFDNRGALITRYRLSEKLRLEVQSGTKQSMDLIYDVEH